MSRRSVGPAWLVVFALAASSCAWVRSDLSSISPSAADRALIAGLAKAGIAVFEDTDASRPVRPVADPSSPIQLLTWQVEALRLQAASGGGILGADLDAVVDERADEPTATMIVLAWALGADTPGAELAREVLRDHVDLPEAATWRSISTPAELEELDRAHPDRFEGLGDVTIPDLVLVLFSSDVARAAEAVELTDAEEEALWDVEEGTGFGRSVLPGQRAGQATPAGAGLCSKVVGFVSDVIAQIFSRIPRLTAPTGGISLFGVRLPTVVADVIGGIMTGAAVLWDGIVDGLRVIVEGVVVRITSALLDPIARIAGIVGTLTTVVNLLRPWWIAFDPDPARHRKAIAPEAPLGGAVGTRIDLRGGLEEWPPDIADCARVSGAPLPPLRPSGNAVTWHVEQSPLGLLHRTEPLTGTLDRSARAVYTYETAVEPRSLVEKGKPADGQMYLNATVERGDTAQIMRFFQQAILSQLGSIAAFLAPYVWTVVGPPVREALDKLLAFRDAQGFVIVPIRYHYMEEEPEPEPLPRPLPVPPAPPRPTPPPDRPPVQCDDCAASLGDPHLITVDGADYSFQGAGEFVLLRSDDGLVEIQVRYEPVGDAVSAQRAVAALVAGRALMWSFEGVLLDGEPLRGPTTFDGAAVTPRFEGGEAIGVEVEFPDGSHLLVAGTSLFVHPSADLRDRGVGLLARSGEAFPLPRLADGTELPEPADADERYELVYERLGPSWAVTDETSLFHYRDGESAATFRTEGFPARSTVRFGFADLDDDERRRGEAACRALTDERLRQRCIFDVGVTADESWATEYTVTEVVLGTSGLPGRGTIGTAPTTTLAPDQPVRGRDGEPAIVLEGLVGGPTGGPRLTGAIEAAEGTVLIARLACPDGVTVSITVEPRGGERGSSERLCDPDLGTIGSRGALARERDEVFQGEGYLWLPASGVYDLEVSATSEEPVEVSVEVYVDPTPTVVMTTAEDLSDLPGTFRLEGIADTVVYVFGQTEVSVSFDAASGFGTGEACGVLAFGAPSPGERLPWRLDSCAHESGRVTVGYLSGLFTVPFIVFNRSGQPVTVEIGAP